MQEFSILGVNPIPGEGWEVHSDIQCLEGGGGVNFQPHQEYVGLEGNFNQNQNYPKMFLKLTTYLSCEEKPLDLHPSAPQDIPDCQDLPNFPPRTPSKLFTDFKALQPSLDIKLLLPEHNEAWRHVSCVKDRLSLSNYY